MHQRPIQWSRSTWTSLFLTLTLSTLFIHGFHPLAEDGGLYVAGIEYKLDPTLFPHYTEFVREHLRFSLFAPCMAALIRLTHLSLSWVLLLLDLLSIWLTLFAVRQVLRRCVQSDAAQLAGVALLAAWWTLPVAGTSLLLMDPYVTARSFSTPLSLLATAYALDDWRGWRSQPFLLCVLCCGLGALLHPLMAFYAVALVIVVRLSYRSNRRRVWAALAGSAVVLASLLQAFAPVESSAAQAAAITRYYWFLSQWQWFELLGLLGPLGVLAALLRFRGVQWSTAAATLCRACIVLGSTAVLIALLFAHEDSAVHLVARLQVLRVFLLLYAVMAMLVGVTLFQLCEANRHRTLRIAPFVFTTVMAGIMFLVQRETFPASQHLEMPWRTERNPNSWVQAFLWCRENTLRDALFALDARYVNTRGEDAQTFRATALRSALPDYSKDGGEASITPALAAEWLRASDAQKDLSYEPDSARDAAVLPLGATWMVLHSSAVTTHPCPYDNHTVKICRLNP